MKYLIFDAGTMGNQKEYKPCFVFGLYLSSPVSLRTCRALFFNGGIVQ